MAGRTLPAYYNAVMWVRPLAESDATCGGKAVGLARLIAAGLPVPDGFVIDDRAFRVVAGELPVALDDIGHALAEAARRIERDDLPPGALVDEVNRRAAALGTLAVRSSATIEDRPAGAAAGVFSSLTAVAPRDVWAAIRAVWTSALTPLAAAYARRTGGDLAIGVIVQQHVTGARLTVYTRPPGAPRGAEVWVQRDAHVRTYVRDDLDPVVALALRAEHAIGAHEGADVELVEDPRAGVIWIVQARPIVHPAPVQRTPPPPSVIAPLVADGRRWTWDVAHNPDPLSAAQAGLVACVERAGFAPWSMRVCAGYLYTAPRELPSVTVRDRDELVARAAPIEAAIERVLAGDAPSLAEAIDRYLAFYRLWACELAPLIAAARARLSPAERASVRPSAVEATLLGAARGEVSEADAIARLGVLSPAWDVAVPTFAERPAIIREAIARARTIAAPAAAPRDGAGADLAHVVADLAERDDFAFARAQAQVRRALLVRAAALGLAPEDVCWLPLDDLLAGAPLDPDDARRRAAAARGAAERATSWAMPLVVGGAEPLTDQGPALRGIGHGPAVTGRVVRYASLATAVAAHAGDIVVTRAITPALAVFVVGCAAIVSETGGPLDHGAALARELGITHVVGCRDAWSRLTSDAIVTIDGDAGTVTVRN